MRCCPYSFFGYRNPAGALHGQNDLGSSLPRNAAMLSYYAAEIFFQLFGNIFDRRFYNTLRCVLAVIFE